MRIIKSFPLTKIFNSTFEAQPTEYDIFLHLAACHVSKADIILIVVLNNTDFRVLYFYLCYKNLFFNSLEFKGLEKRKISQASIDESASTHILGLK